MRLTAPARSNYIISTFFCVFCGLMTSQATANPQSPLIPDAVAGARALIVDYWPYPGLKLQQCRVSTSEEQKLTFPRSERFFEDIEKFGVKQKDGRVMMNYQSDFEFGNSVSIKDKNGVDRLIETNVSNHFSSGPVKQLTYDLNGDGITDYILEFQTGDAGGRRKKVVFITSQGSSYRLVGDILVDSEIEGRNFVDLKGDGSCQFIHGNRALSPDPKNLHTYFAFNLFEFTKEGTLEPANYLVPEKFPAWVQFTNQNNRKLSKLVTKNMQEQFVRTYKFKEIVPGTPYDPNDMSD